MENITIQPSIYKLMIINNDMNMYSNLLLDKSFNKKKYFIYITTLSNDVCNQLYQLKLDEEKGSDNDVTHAIKNDIDYVNYRFNCFIRNMKNITPREISIFLDNGANVNLQLELTKFTFLICLSIEEECNEYIEAMDYLIQCGANVNLQSHYGWTALHYAAKYNNIRTVKLLLKYGVNINLRTYTKKRINLKSIRNAPNNNETALDIAIRYKHDRIAVLLGI